MKKSKRIEKLRDAYYAAHRDAYGFGRDESVDSRGRAYAAGYEAGRSEQFHAEAQRLTGLQLDAEHKERERAGRGKKASKR